MKLFFWNRGNRKVKKEHPIYRARRSFLDWMKIFVFLGLALLGTWGGIRFFWGSTHFQITEIEVRGRLTHLKGEEVVRLARAPFGQNLFSISLSQISWQILRHPWVHHVRVRRNFPQGLIIEVEEYIPLCVVAATVKDKKGEMSGFEHYLVSTEGILFMKTNDVKPDLPLVLGFVDARLAKFPKFYRSKLNMVFEMIEKFGKDEGNSSFPIRKIFFDEMGSIEMVVAHAKNGCLNGNCPQMKIYFGRTNWDQQIKKWGNLREAMLKRGDFFSTVDLHVAGKIFVRS